MATLYGDKVDYTIDDIVINGNCTIKGALITKGGITSVTTGAAPLVLTSTLNFLGDSIAAGANVNSNQRWTTLVSQKYGKTENNQAVSGTTWGDLQSVLYGNTGIPRGNTTFLAFGTNDLRLTAATGTIDDLIRCAYSAILFCSLPPSSVINARSNAVTRTPNVSTKAFVVTGGSLTSVGPATQMSLLTITKPTDFFGNGTGATLVFKGTLSATTGDTVNVTWGSQTNSTTVAPGTNVVSFTWTVPATTQNTIMSAGPTSITIAGATLGVNGASVVATINYTGGSSWTNSGASPVWGLGTNVIGDTLTTTVTGRYIAFSTWITFFSMIGNGPNFTVSVDGTVVTGNPNPQIGTYQSTNLGYAEQLWLYDTGVTTPNTSHTVVISYVSFRGIYNDAFYVNWFAGFDPKPAGAATVFLSPVVPYSQTNWGGNEITRQILNQSYATAANTLSSTYGLPVYCLGTHENVTFPGMSADLLHPDASGHQMMAQNIIKSISTYSQ